MHSRTAQERSEHDIVGWRRDQLVESGFPRRLASRIARDRRFDLHALIELSERGCPPEFAVRIMAPLESGGPTV
jgi:hypothetical protein